MFQDPAQVFTLLDSSPGPFDQAPQHGNSRVLRLVQPFSEQAGVLSPGLGPSEQGHLSFEFLVFQRPWVESFEFFELKTKVVDPPRSVVALPSVGFEVGALPDERAVHARVLGESLTQIRGAIE